MNDETQPDCVCGHPASHHDGGICWTDRDGRECYDDEACPCIGYRAAS